MTRARLLAEASSLELTQWQCYFEAEAKRSAGEDEETVSETNQTAAQGLMAAIAQMSGKA